MSAADAPATHRDRQRLVLRLAELGIPTTDTDAQRHVCAVWTKGRARKRSELTKQDAGSLYARLQTMTREELAGVLAMPAPDVEPAPEPQPEPVAVDQAACLASWDQPAPELPPGVIVCGPGPVTEHDAAKVRAFADFLATAGPPPTRAEVDAVRGCPVEEGTAMSCPHPVATCCMTEAADAEGTGPLSDVPHEEQAPEPNRALTVAGWVGIPGRFVPLPGIEPPPDDVEAAAVAAVERFRARQAAGIVPEAPDPSTRPPRVPQTMPPAKDRYCLARCYCGECPQYAEQKEAAERAYRQELTAARNRDPRDSGNTRRRR